MARIFTLLAFVLSVNLFTPIVNTYSPYSTTSTTQVAQGFKTSNVIDAVGCATSTAGQVSSATSTSLTDTTQNWGSNVYANAGITITSGADRGDQQTVQSNTATSITIGTTGWVTTLHVGDTFIVNDVCSASVSGGFSNTILGPVVNTILVFGNFFAAGNFLVQLVGGVVAPSFYIMNWLGGANYAPAVELAGLYQAIVWIAYGYGLFYILSGRVLHGGGGD